eukprot:5100451-Ditylum_brightwellii.AAC.1
MRRKDMDTEFKTNMGHFLSSMICTEEKAKAESGDSLDERKKYMTFEWAGNCLLLHFGTTKGDVNINTSHFNAHRKFSNK